MQIDYLNHHDYHLVKIYFTNKTYRYDKKNNQNPSR